MDLNKPCIVRARHRYTPTTLAGVGGDSEEDSHDAPVDGWDNGG